MCDKILEWTRQACYFPLSFWKGANNPNRKKEASAAPLEGKPHTRALAIYKAIRAVYKKSKIQYADAKEIDKDEDTFYVHPYFFHEIGGNVSADILCRMDQHGFGIMDFLTSHIRDRTLKWQSGLRERLGPRSGAAWRQPALTGREPWRQIKDKEPKEVLSPDVEDNAEQQGEWQDYDSEWWNRADQSQEDTAFGRWREPARPWRTPKPTSSSSQPASSRSGWQESSRTQSSASSHRAQPYQENPWSERSETWKRRS